MLEAVAQAAALPARRGAARGDAGRQPGRGGARGPDARRAGLRGFSLTLFRPVLPMLAQPAEDIGDALEQLGEAALEWKLDGARVQVHKSGDEVRVYTPQPQRRHAGGPRDRRGGARCSRARR